MGQKNLPVDLCAYTSVLLEQESTPLSSKPDVFATKQEPPARMSTPVQSHTALHCSTSLQILSPLAASG